MEGFIIYGLIIIIALITQFAKKIKKLAAEEKAKPVYNQMPTQPERPKSTTKQVNKKKKVNKTMTETVVRSTPVENEHPITVQEEFNVIGENNYDFSDVSEIKKAVIYSEILNRKY